MVAWKDLHAGRSFTNHKGIKKIEEQVQFIDQQLDYDLFKL